MNINKYIFSEFSNSKSLSTECGDECKIEISNGHKIDEPFIFNNMLVAFYGTDVIPDPKTYTLAEMLPIIEGEAGITFEYDETNKSSNQDLNLIPDIEISSFKSAQGRYSKYLFQGILLSFDDITHFDFYKAKYGGNFTLGIVARHNNVVRRLADMSGIWP